MSPDVDRFIPIAALLIAILLGFIGDVMLGTTELWRIAAPVGLIAGFVARWMIRSKFRAR